MRTLLAVLCLAGSGCIIEPPDDDYPPPSDGGGWGSGWGGGGGTSGYGCQSDAACGTGNVCARNGECTSATNVRIVHVLWTLKGQTATDTTCASAPKLAITFSTTIGSDMFGFSPVPCDAGKFTIDKLPTRYSEASLSRTSDSYGGDSGSFDAQGNVTLDLPY